MKATFYILAACVCLYLVARAAQIGADAWQITLVNLENYPQSCVPQAKDYEP